MSENPNNPYVYARPASAALDGTPHDAQTGITLREYYAHGAPWPIPDWFKPSDIPTKPYEVIHPDVYFGVFDPTNEDKSDEIRSETYNTYYDFENNTWNDAQYRHDNGSSAEIDPLFKDAVAIQRAAYLVYLSELEYWQLDYDKERYFQWRWYYADEMLIERLGGDIS